jgi:hypothetical protein
MTFSPELDEELSKSIAQAVVVIRDFAFPADDPRYTGEPHPDAGKPVASSLDSRLDAVDDLQSSESASGSKFSWGFVTSHAGSSDFDATETPSGDHRPFGLDRFSDDELSSDDDGEFFDVAGDQGGLGNAELPEIPPSGLLYVAAYPFEPEAAQEMKLQEGDVVRVWERVCEGWVVAGRVKTRTADDGTVAFIEEEEDGEEMESGLVPEDFLVRHDASS